MQRQKQLTDWLSSLYPNESFTLAPASADASFRRYFRATFADGSTKVVMDAPPQHEDCKPFLHVGKLFEEAGTHVPHVYAQDLAQGFLLLSDLGNTTYLQALDGTTARDLYAAATDALINIQLASRKNELPSYDEALLRRELNLFPEWYIAKHLGVTLTDKQQAKLEEVFARILANNLSQPCVYVHRDYHSRNLMYIESPLSNSRMKQLAIRLSWQTTPASRWLPREREKGQREAIFNLARHPGFSGCSIRPHYL